MRVISNIAEMQGLSRDVRARGKSLALVPTMGAVHEGHFSLVRRAKGQCDAVVVSIFVNPKQFDSAGDLARYPQNLESDVESLRPFKIDAVFAPSAGEVYPEGFSAYVEPGEIAGPLEGTLRPGHFRGVATIVVKLFNIVRPDVAYFGQKDFQQALAVHHLIEDLNLDARLVICPIVREADRLAASSRNSRLTAEDRQAALALHRSLRRAEMLAHSGEADARAVAGEMKKVIEAEPRVTLEYAAIVEPVRLQPVDRVTVGCVALVAARVGGTRLIDNLIFGPPGASPDMLLQLALTARPIAHPRTLIPGFETEAVKLTIASCRECAAISTIQLPPRAFLSSYIREHYPDRSMARIAVIGRDAPMKIDNSLYQNPEQCNRFVRGLYDLLGVKDFAEFGARFVLTDVIRCHCTGPRLPEKALAHCARHLRAELKLFPNLEALVILGDDAYAGFQRHLLDRRPGEVKPFEKLLEAQGWAREDIRVPGLGECTLKVFYCHHPTLGYKRSPSIASLLP